LAFSQLCWSLSACTEFSYSFPSIAVRLAFVWLGASRGRVVAAMLGNACLMLGIGLVAGTALALLAGRGASTLLFGLKSCTLAGAAALLALVTVVASVVPSLRAVNVNGSILSVRSRRGTRKMCNLVAGHRL
jgi:hypothetical protein